MYALARNEKNLQSVLNIIYISRDTHFTHFAPYEKLEILIFGATSYTLDIVSKITILQQNTAK